MSEYILIAENIIFKRGKLSCINVYNELSTVLMPAEFKFDLAVFCGPKWSKGEHELSVKAVANGNRVMELGSAKVDIPHENFVYNAFLNDITIRMDQSVTDLTFIVSDGGKEIISRTYPVRTMFSVQPQKAPEQKEEKKAKKDKK